MGASKEVYTLSYALFKRLMLETNLLFSFLQTISPIIIFTCGVEISYCVLYCYTNAFTFLISPSSILKFYSKCSCNVYVNRNMTFLNHFEIGVLKLFIYFSCRFVLGIISHTFLLLINVSAYI